MKMPSPFRRPAPTDTPFGSIARSHIGKVRTVNEDRLLNCPEHGLWAIADGMGGHSLGDKAATMVVRALARLAENGRINRASIAQALEQANATIGDLARAEGQICGSTVAGMHIGGGHATIFWAGDSRIYRLRAGRLERLSRDHSVVQEMADAGLLTDQQARLHPNANVITRAVGVSERLCLDFNVCPIEPADLFMLCSDGLSSAVGDAPMASMLGSDLDGASARLLQAALEAGGVDNISLILVARR